MSKQSAGILAYRRTNKLPEVLLVHPGGPFFMKKDIGAWSIPKGEFTDDETPLNAARREFKEELGSEISGDFIELSPVKQKGGKIVYAWAVECDLDTTQIISNTFSLEWPPKSGRIKAFPEIDKAEWFVISVAKEKINESQVKFIDELVDKVEF